MDVYYVQVKAFSPFGPSIIWKRTWRMERHSSEESSTLLIRGEMIRRISSFLSAARQTPVSHSRTVRSPQLDGTATRRMQEQCFAHQSRGIHHRPTTVSPWT